MREVGFGIPVMPQGSFYIFADVSRWTDNFNQFAFELHRLGVSSHRRAAGSGLRASRQTGGEIQIREFRGECSGGEEALVVGGDVQAGSRTNTPQPR